MTNNYICINGKKTDIPEELINQILEKVNNTKLSSVPVGETVKIGRYEFIVLEHSKETTAVILKDLLMNSARFGSTNDFKTSEIRSLLAKFAAQLAEIVGGRNLITHRVKLTSDDGLEDYGSTFADVSLLTCDLYRRYVKILDKHKLDKWWWLATPLSTPTHGDSTWVKCVSPSGYIGDNYCFYYGGGVRPFCILNSDIFVSR